MVPKFELSVFFLLFLNFAGIRFLSAEGAETEKTATSCSGSVSKTKDGELARLGCQLLEHHEYQKAKQAYDKAIAKNPTEASYYQWRGKCYLKLQKWLEAVIDFQQAQALAKNSGKEGSIVFNEIELATLGENLLQRLEQRKAYWCFSELVKINPFEASYYRSLGQSVIGALNLEDAFSKYQEIIARSSDFGKGTHFLRFENLKELGETSLEYKHFSKAFWFFDQAIKINSSDAACYIKRGLCYAKFDYLDEAVSDFEKAVELKPDNLVYWNILLHSLFHRENGLDEANEKMRLLRHNQLWALVKDFESNAQYEDATQVLTELIRRDSNNFEAHRSRGHFYVKLEQYEKAFADFSRASQLHSDDSSAKRDVAAWCSILEKEINMKKDFKKYLASKRKDPQNPVFTTPEKTLPKEIFVN